MRSAFLGAVALSFVAAASFAADLPAIKTTSPPPPPIFTWTGLYFGLNAGVSVSNSSVQTLLQGAFLTSPGAAGYQEAFGTTIANNRTGFVGGGTAGYNWQNGMFVFGVEGDIDYQNNNRNVAGSSGPPAFATRTIGLFDGSFGTLRPRVGVAFGQALVYATGGLAVGAERASLFYTDTPGYSWSGGSSAIRAGWTLGGGLEYAVAPNWSIKGEYLYVGLGDKTYGLTNGAANPLQTFTLAAKQRDGFSVVRVGVNYLLH